MTSALQNKTADETARRPRRHGGFALSPGLAFARRIERRFPARGMFVPVPGGRLHALHRSRREVAGRRPAILLHGASGNACDMGLELFDRLAAQRPVFAFDRPGHGWSDRPGGAADAAPDRQGKLILAALDEMQMPDCILVAHSWSGGLAMNMALEHPGAVAGVVLVAAATHPWPGGVISWYHDAAAHGWLGRGFSHLAPLALGIVDRAVDAAFRPQRTVPDYVRRSALPLLFRPSQFRHNAQDMAGLHAFLTKQAPRYGELCVPVTAIVSDADPVVPMAHSVELARQSDKVELKVLSGLGHMLQHVAAPAIAEAVEALDAKLDASASA